jgi:hypothetical protein
VPVEPTLGERLDAQGRRLAGRFDAAFSWAPPLALALLHATALAVGPSERFTRIEVDPQERPRPRPAPRPLSPPPPPPTGTAGSPGRPLPAATAARLADRAGAVGSGAAVAAGAAAMRVHDDPVADTVARTHRADAVTLGRDVHFRAGRYRPHEEPGLGLLAHEATHVHALLAPGPDWRRATSTGRAAEEALADATERAVRTGADLPRVGGSTAATVKAGDARSPAEYGPRSGRAGVAAQAGWTGERPARPAPPAPGPTPSTAAATPMSAATGRDLAEGASQALDVGALRRELFDGVLADLRRQLRSESERGG